MGNATVETWDVLSQGGMNVHSSSSAALLREGMWFLVSLGLEKFTSGSAGAAQCTD